MGSYKHPEVLVSTDWVAERGAVDGVAVVEVNVDTDLYDQGHVPGAIGWSWKTQLADQVRRDMALYIGGMGARGKNFYTDYAGRLGYAAAAAEIQDKFLAGQRAEAAAAVPDQLIDDVALVGPAARIRERLGPWREAGAKGHVGSLLAGNASVDAIRLLAEELL